MKIKLSDIKRDTDLNIFDDDNEKCQRKEEKRRRKDEKKERKKRKKLLKLQNEAFKNNNKSPNFNDYAESFNNEVIYEKNKPNIINMCTKTETSMFEFNTTQNNLTRLPCWRDSTLSTTNSVTKQVNKDFAPEVKNKEMSNGLNGLKLRIPKLLLSSSSTVNCKLFATKNNNNNASDNSGQNLNNKEQSFENVENHRQKSYSNKSKSEKRHKNHKRGFESQLQNDNDIQYESKLTETDQLSSFPRLKIRIGKYKSENCMITDISENAVKFERSKSGRLDSNVYCEIEDTDEVVKSKKRRRNKNGDDLKCKSKHGSKDKSMNLLNETNLTHDSMKDWSLISKNDETQSVLTQEMQYHINGESGCDQHHQNLKDTGFNQKQRLSIKLNRNKFDQSKEYESFSIYKEKFSSISHSVNSLTENSDLMIEDSAAAALSASTSSLTVEDVDRLLLGDNLKNRTEHHLNSVAFSNSDYNNKDCVSFNLMQNVNLNGRANERVQFSPYTGNFDFF